MTTAATIARNSLTEDFAVTFVDTADRRGLANVGKFEMTNVLLALKHGLQFLQLLLSKRPRIVYIPISQQWLPFLRDCLFLVPARVLRRKVIVHLHGGHFGRFYRESNALMRAIIRVALSKAERVVVLGDCLRDLFKGIVPSDRIAVIPNGIEDFGTNDIPLRKSHAPTLLFLSALMKEKGILDLLSVMPEIRECCPDVSLVVTGEWLNEGDRKAAEQLIVEHGLKNCVHFTGPIGAPDKYDLFRAADMFVLPTYYPNEGHPYAILEAMCAGLPVVSTDVACIPETVIDGITGYIVPRRDTAALAERIAMLLKDSDLRVRMGKAARRRFREQYTTERFACELRAAFRDVSESASA